MVFRVKPPVHLESLSGTWLGQEVLFDFYKPTRTWYGVGGCSLHTPPGIHALTLKGETSSGKVMSAERRIVVRRAKYPSIALKVPAKFTEPSPEQLQQIDQEKTLKQDIFSRIDPQREWSGAFRPAVNAKISDRFGTQRTFNGEVKSLHQGLDYAVPKGTPVAALNRGIVLLARPMFFEGNCVILDHGQGLLTIYMHLSDILVKEGETVSRGQKIGLSGGTGRATGPHLHVAVRWQGVYLNPATLMTLSLPSYAASQKKTTEQNPSATAGMTVADPSKN